jgi:hypothetical protein
MVTSIVEKSCKMVDVVCLVESLQKNFDKPRFHQGSNSTNNQTA